MNNYGKIQVCKTVNTMKSTVPQIKHNLYNIRVFTICTKLVEMALLYLKDLTTAKKVTSSGAQPDARNYFWFRSPMPNHMS